MLSVLSQDHMRPARMCDGLRQLFAEPRPSLKVCSAYITPGGLELLGMIAEQEIGASAWQRLPKEFTTCLDYGTTTPDALRQLLTLENSTTYIANADVVHRARFKPVNAFHPKAYCVHSDQRGRLLCGSANLTRHGLTVNAEMGVLTNDTESVNEFVSAFRLLDRRTQLDEPLIATYEAKRGDQVEGADEDEPIPTPVVPNELSAFNDFVLALGDNDMPKRFWIEAGSMSSSGSHHQLELPRLGNRYFGFSYDTHDNAQRDIGAVSLLKASDRWDDRRLVWHGDNGMERIYLPTQAEGGVSYVNKAILFEEVESERGAFHLTAVPWGSEIARSWINASIASELVFRVPQNPRPNARICGLLN